VTATPPPPFSKRGPVWYKIENMPSGALGQIKHEGIRPIIADACGAWSAVSPFDFMDMDEPPAGQQPPPTADVIFTFEQLPTGLNPNAVAAVPPTTNPRKVIIRPDLPWTTPKDFLKEKQGYSWVGRSSFLHTLIQEAADYFTVQTDLRTITVHEVGHVLGLNHNNDDKSVMQEQVDYFEWRYFLGEEGIPSVDIVSLDGLYGPQDDLHLTDAPPYAIVGGRMSAGNMASQGFKDDPFCAWGEDVRDRVMLGAGYGFNPSLRAEGYCHVVAYLMPWDQRDTTVQAVVGGFANIDGYGHPPIAGLPQWGRKTDSIQLFARLMGWYNGDDHVICWYWYLDDWSEHNPPALFSSGEQIQYDAGMKVVRGHAWQWGKVPPGDAGALTLAVGRTWIDSQPKNSNAYSSYVAFPAQP
jgi:hypothetical protein